MTPLTQALRQATPTRAKVPASVWLQAIRPRTLSAGAMPVLLGIGLAHGDGVAKVLPAAAALLGALLIQIGTNLANDYYDFKRGADTSERLGPVRVTQSGLIPPGTVWWGSVLCFAAATVVGVYLVAVGGWPILVLGVLSLLAGFAYTGGPFPLGYLGLGDALVFLFFGFAAVAGTYYVQAGRLTPAFWFPAVAAGSLGTALLVVNNLRDVVTDARAGKRTLVVRWGARAARIEYFSMLAIAFLSPAVLWLSGWGKAWVLLPLISMPLAVAPLRRVLHRSGAELNPALGETARLQTGFGVLFALGLWIG